MKLPFLLAVLAHLAASPVQAQVASEPGPSPAPIQAEKIILVGDSTTAVLSGWGSAFCARHVLSRLTCVNLAREGRSTSSYRAEGSWDIALGEMSTPGYARTYVLIQFGHNDQPGKPGRSTDLATEFPANLARYVVEAQARGAIPVLVTPLARRQFVDGVQQNTLEPWAEAARRVAAETGAPLVDLNRISAQAVQAMGPAVAASLAQLPPPPEVAAALLSGTTVDLPPANRPHPVEGAFGEPTLAFDYTHLGRDGAAFVAVLMTQELGRALPELRPSLVP